MEHFICTLACFLITYFSMRVDWEKDCGINDHVDIRILMALSAFLLNLLITGNSFPSNACGSDFFFLMIGFPLLAIISGLVLGGLIPPFSEWLTGKIVTVTKLVVKTTSERKQADRVREGSSPRHLRKLCAGGVANVRIVAHRNQKFWEPMMAFVRVLATKGKGAKSELDRLLARRLALEADIKRLREGMRQRQTNRMDDTSFVANRGANIASLERRLSNVNSLISLIVTQLNELDDDMVEIETDLPTAESFAIERRDGLIKELRTTLDAIELEIGASARRSQELAIALSDEETALLTSGALRQVQVDAEINARLVECGLRPLDQCEPATGVQPNLATRSRQRA
jgi:hypothetical protein